MELGGKMLFSKHVRGEFLSAPLHNSIDINGLTDFLKSNPNITALDLRDDKTDDEGAKALARFTSLTRLNLPENNISDEVTEELLDSLERLTSFDLFDNKDEVEQLVESTIQISEVVNLQDFQKR